MSTLNTYKIWFDCNEAWDPNDIDPPVEVEAASAYEAACLFAERDYRFDDERCSDLIVQDEHGQYIMIEVRRHWEVHRSRFTSLAELCDEEGEAAP